MNVREQFEHYMRSQNPCVRLARQSSRLPHSEYRTITVERAWKLWQTSWAIATYLAEKPESRLLGLPVIDPSLLPEKESA